MPESFLKKIIQTKKKELAEFHKPDFRRKDPKVRSLKRALSRPRHSFGLIAEIKQASPSKGVFRTSLDADALARAYDAAGADAISVLTDRTYFHGSFERLRSVRHATGLPILCKDFIIDPRQIEEAYQAGADAILLIAAALDPERISRLYRTARSLGLEALVEVHRPAEAEAIFRVFTPEIIGINNRDLATFQTDLQVTETVRPLIPGGVLVVSESGVHRVADIEFLRRQHVQAALIGEALICADSPEQKIADLLRQVNANASDA